MPRGGRRSTSFKPFLRQRLYVGRDPSPFPSLGLLRPATGVAPEAISTLKTIMLSERAPPAARIGAATALLDRGYGKSKQEVEVVAPDLSRLTDDELDALEQIMERATLLPPN